MTKNSTPEKETMKLLEEQHRAMNDECIRLEKELSKIWEDNKEQSTIIRNLRNEKKKEKGMIIPKRDDLTRVDWMMAERWFNQMTPQAQLENIMDLYYNKVMLNEK